MTPADLLRALQHVPGTAVLCDRSGRPVTHYGATELVTFADVVSALESRDELNEALLRGVAMDAFTAWHMQQLHVRPADDWMRGIGRCYDAIYHERTTQDGAT